MQVPMHLHTCIHTYQSTAIRCNGEGGGRTSELSDKGEDPADAHGGGPLPLQSGR